MNETIMNDGTEAIKAMRLPDKFTAALIEAFQTAPSLDAQIHVMALALAISDALREIGIVKSPGPVFVSNPKLALERN